MSENAEEREPTRHLSVAECWDRIREAPYGRIAVAAGGEVDVFPVNHAVDGTAIFFRTAAGTKLLELTIHSHVTFQVDGFSEHEAFSVAAKGTAREFDRQGEIAQAERLGIEPWAPELKDRWVRIDVTELHGRTFTRP